MASSRYEAAMMLVKVSRPRLLGGGGEEEEEEQEEEKWEKEEKKKKRRRSGRGGGGEEGGDNNNNNNNNNVSCLFFLLFTHDNLVMQALVWLCMVWFRVIQFTSYMNLRTPQIFKHQILGKNLTLHLSKYGLHEINSCEAGPCHDKSANVRSSTIMINFLVHVWVGFARWMQHSSFSNISLYA